MYTGKGVFVVRLIGMKVVRNKKLYKGMLAFSGKFEWFPANCMQKSMIAEYEATPASYSDKTAYEKPRVLPFPRAKCTVERLIRVIGCREEKKKAQAAHDKAAVQRDAGMNSTVASIGYTFNTSRKCGVPPEQEKKSKKKVALKDCKTDRSLKFHSLGTSACVAAYCWQCQLIAGAEMFTQSESASQIYLFMLRLFEGVGVQPPKVLWYVDVAHMFASLFFVTWSSTSIFSLQFR